MDAQIATVAATDAHSSSLNSMMAAIATTPDDPSVVRFNLGDPNDESDLWELLGDPFYQRLRNDPDFKKIYDDLKANDDEIVFTTAPGDGNRAEYLPGRGTIIVYLEEGLDPRTIAEALIHEGIHAGIDQRDPNEPSAIPPGVNDLKHDPTVVGTGLLPYGISEIPTDHPYFEDHPEFREYMDENYPVVPGTGYYSDQNKEAAEFIDSILERLAIQPS